jgi:hypothetical protein
MRTRHALTRHDADGETEQQSFVETYQHALDQIYRFVLRCLGRREDAVDVTEVFVWSRCLLSLQRCRGASGALHMLSMAIDHKGERIKE